MNYRLLGNRTSVRPIKPDTPQIQVFERVVFGDPLKAIEVLVDYHKRMGFTMASIHDADDHSGCPNGRTLYLWCIESGIVINDLFEEGT